MWPIIMKWVYLLDYSSFIFRLHCNLEPKAQCKVSLSKPKLSRSDREGSPLIVSDLQEILYLSRLVFVLARGFRSLPSPGRPGASTLESSQSTIKDIIQIQAFIDYFSTQRNLTSAADMTIFFPFPAF